MQELRTLLMLTLLLIGAGCQRSSAPGPRLVVMITIDGLGADLLERYDGAFVGGIRRLKDRGYQFTNARVDHAITVSHAGHVTLATGRYPSAHGIVDAAFYMQGDSGRVLVDAVADSSYPIVGMDGVDGASPRRILTDGIADWLRADDERSRALAIGSGNVSSLLHVFRPGSDVYWYRNGRYVTSSYYQTSYPDWVTHFNETILPDHLRRMDTWNDEVPDSVRDLSRPDASPYEGDLVHTTFPHRITDELGGRFRQDSTAARSIWIQWTPTLDLTTLALARDGVRGMGLGTGESTDYLSIVLSTLDSQTHYYGPGSREVFDILLRIDEELELFFRFLDEQVGEDSYVVAFSADHGFPEIPEIAAKEGKPGRRLSQPEIDAVLSRIRRALNGAAGDEATRQRIVQRELSRWDAVEEVYLTSDLTESQPEDPFLRLYQHSYRRDRVPRLPLFSLETFTSPVAQEGVMVRLERGAIINIDRDTHGSPYDYDRKVPLLFYGRGVPSGSSDEDVRTIDVAPTLSRLAGVEPPPDIDGRPLGFPD